MSKQCETPSLSTTSAEPCAVDNQHKLRDAFKNDQGYVPAYYLFDGEGKLRSFAAGERGLDMLSAALDRVLAQANEAQMQN